MPGLYPTFDAYHTPEENTFRYTPNEELEWQRRRAERSGSGSISGISPEFDSEMISEINRRSGESDDLFKLALADLGVTGLQTGLDLAGKAQGFSQYLPYVGSAIGALQAAKTQSAMINPYGSGSPSGAHMPIDIAENSIGYLSRANPLLGIAGQTIAGGFLSDLANMSSADEENARIAGMINRGDFGEAERELIPSRSRHWNRNKVSNMGSSKIQSVEDKRRAVWATQYGQETDPSKRRSMIESEAESRRNYDNIQASAPWFESLYKGVEMMLAKPEDEQKILGEWTSGVGERNKHWDTFMPPGPL